MKLISQTERQVKYFGVNKIHELLDCFPWGQNFIEQLYNFTNWFRTKIDTSEKRLFKNKK